MTISGATVNHAHERHIPVEDNRVACPRMGTVELDRCRECVYLLRIELAGTPPAGHVVCAGSHVDAELDAWGTPRDAVVGRRGWERPR